MTTTVTVHQPMLFPAAFYVQRWLQADVHVWLRSVQFTRKFKDSDGVAQFSGQNSTLFRGKDGPVRFTVPVPKGSARAPICEIEVGVGWHDRFLSTFKACYGESWLLTHLDDWLKTAPARLDVLNIESTRFVMSCMPVREPVWRTDTDPMMPRGAVKSDRILQLVEAVEGTRYLAGRTSIDGYLNRLAFSAAGVRVVAQDWWPEPWGPSSSWSPGLSALDAIAFNADHLLVP